MPPLQKMLMFPEHDMPALPQKSLVLSDHDVLALLQKTFVLLKYDMPPLLLQTLMSDAADVDAADTHVRATTAPANVEVRRSRC